MNDMDHARIAFQGELGAYSEEAARRLFGPELEPVPCRDFREVGEAVALGAVDAGLLPIENSLAGSVVGSYDVLAAQDLEVVGEVITEIHHCVLGTPGATLEGVSRVLSHPVALAQCTRFLGSHTEVEAVAVYDTAGAAKQVAEQGDAATAAIAGRPAAERYGLTVLAANVEDRPDNQTRFLAVVRPGRPPPALLGVQGADPPRLKAALLVETANEPGALVRVLTPLASHGINLTKLESRPGPEPWTYRFFMELETLSSTAALERAVTEARSHAAALRVLGTFVPARGEEPIPGAAGSTT
jgi:prephenate dehydratase